MLITTLYYSSIDPPQFKAAEVEHLSGEILYIVGLAGEKSPCLALILRA